MNKALSIQPQNIEAEQAVLGGVILDGLLGYARELKKGDFYEEAHRVIFEAMKGLNKNTTPIDLITLSDALRKAGTLDKAGGQIYIAQLADITPTSANMPYYIRIVKEKAIAREIHKKLTETPGALEKGDLGAILGDLTAFSERMALDYHYNLIPQANLADYIKEKYAREQERDPKKRLGYELTRFEAIAKEIDGIQPGFYIIGAETNIGKTAFLTNLFLDILETNPETQGLYFSLDDNKDVIINRFLSIKTNMNLNRVQRRQDHGSFDEKNLKETVEHLSQLHTAGRLDVKDISEISHIDLLEREIRSRAGSNLFVVIDGLYNLDVGQAHKGLREENIDRANKVKALVDAYKIPIIATGELRKRNAGEKQKSLSPSINDLMETGKFAYNANLVLLLYAQNPDAFKNDDEPILQVDFVKNKLSPFKGVLSYQFIRAKSKIEPLEIKGFDHAGETWDTRKERVKS